MAIFFNWKLVLILLLFPRLECSHINIEVIEWFLFCMRTSNFFAILFFMFINSRQCWIHFGWLFGNWFSFLWFHFALANILYEFIKFESIFLLWRSIWIVFWANLVFKIDLNRVHASRVLILGHFLQYKKVVGVGSIPKLILLDIKYKNLFSSA